MPRAKYLVSRRTTKARPRAVPKAVEEVNERLRNVEKKARHAEPIQPGFDTVDHEVFRQNVVMSAVKPEPRYTPDIVINTDVTEYYLHQLDVPMTLAQVPVYVESQLRNMRNFFRPREEVTSVVVTLVVAK